MPEAVTFHFEGALADVHRMNFYESARFQYAASRLMVKLSQFRQTGRFQKNISNKFNHDIQLIGNEYGSFNINVEEPPQNEADEPFIKVSISDLIAFVSERLIDKINEGILKNSATTNDNFGDLDGTPSVHASTIESLASDLLAGKPLIGGLPIEVQDLIKRRVAEIYRQRRAEATEHALSKIDATQSQKLMGMAAPLLSEMAVPLRKSANTLEIITNSTTSKETVLFLNKDMANDIETATIDKDAIQILGDITQFNKDNGWGKIRVNMDGAYKIVSFSIPSDILSEIKNEFIDKMKIDSVYLKVNVVRDRSKEVNRLIVFGILPTPDS